MEKHQKRQAEHSPHLTRRLGLDGGIPPLFVRPHGVVPSKAQWL